ncbi:MAG TPA: sodium:solute symporter, partial [Micromonosporaceae bacterium]
PAWSAGIAYATIAVAALIPAAITSIGAANLFTRAIYVEYFRPRASAGEEARISRWASLLATSAAAGFLLVLTPSISLDLQTIGGVLILQILPTVFFGLLTGWFHRWALMFGMLGGLGWSLYLLYGTPRVFGGVVMAEHFGGVTMPLSRLGLSSEVNVYIGLVTLAANLLVVIVATAILKLVHASPNLDHTRSEDYVLNADVERIDETPDLLEVARRNAVHAQR